MRKHISASEVADYIYCNRALLYKLRQENNTNASIMQQGTKNHVRLHQSHILVQRLLLFTKIIVLISLLGILAALLFLFK